MRTNDEIREYRRDIGHTDDTELCDAMDALLAGDESQRQRVEKAMAQIDEDTPQ